MEYYTGIKFTCTKIGDVFDCDERLTTLNSWTWILAELGLTPVHPDGAYGNQSYRSEGDSIVITKSGMLPEQRLVIENYTLIEGHDRKTGNMITRGRSEPSSESLLHLLIYREFPGVGAIMHGHSRLFEHYADQLFIPVTPAFHPYGTIELAQSTTEFLKENGEFIFMKNHGFVAIGMDIDTTGRLVLGYYGRLLDLLKSRACPSPCGA